MGGLAKGLADGRGLRDVGAVKTQSKWKRAAGWIIGIAAAAVILTAIVYSVWESFQWKAGVPSVLKGLYTADDYGMKYKVQLTAAEVVIEAREDGETQFRVKYLIQRYLERNEGTEWKLSDSSESTAEGAGDDGENVIYIRKLSGKRYQIRWKDREWLDIEKA